MITFLGDFAALDSDIASEYKISNPYVLNCEYVIGDSDELTPKPGKINLKGSFCDFKSIFGRNPMAVTIANNHIFDYGETGYQLCLKTLEEHEILCVSEKPICHNNVYILAYMDIDGATYGEEPFYFNKDVIKKTIDNIKQNRDAKIVVVMHWGIENSPIMEKRQVEKAHWLIDIGADLIIGHHPHCIQPIELYKNKYIFYSIGNAFFPNFALQSHYDKNGKSSRVYRIRWQKWNRYSLAVKYDENTGNVSIDKLYQKKNAIKLYAENIAVNQIKVIRAGKYIYKLRKYLLFLLSNVCVDGKLFDLEALKAEMRK